MKDEKKTLGGRGRHAGVTPEFRAEAVRLVETSGRSVAAIAEDLGIGKSGAVANFCFGCKKVRLSGLQTL
ncbi:hypothetical protein [Asticcacaulis sp. EMRT-3]|uniref:hypothetical protein n=1 Tax=Asticcacaulis sp. EMRT-3 TaxID=3040349 RepID=UPI0024AF0C5E|nr:hypothetical protein [Asticcacaulis sp. EMRT-3]MDI7776680.1 hypothetical protein [Asticcacaulis sp. EMRT-3]